MKGMLPFFSNVLIKKSNAGPRSSEKTKIIITIMIKNTVVVKFILNKVQEIDIFSLSSKALFEMYLEQRSMVSEIKLEGFT